MEAHKLSDTSSIQKHSDYSLDRVNDLYQHYEQPSNTMRTPSSPGAFAGSLVAERMLTADMPNKANNDSYISSVDENSSGVDSPLTSPLICGNVSRDLCQEQRKD